MLYFFYPLRCVHTIHSPQSHPQFKEIGDPPTGTPTPLPPTILSLVLNSYHAYGIRPLANSWYDINKQQESHKKEAPITPTAPTSPAICMVM